MKRKFLTKPVRFEGIQRIEELEYPVAALREMLLNALVHRNYLGSMTQMKVYDDRLTLWNAGTLPEELTIEQLFQAHESIPRNPLIAEVCYKVGYIDSWGRGVEKISEACQGAGLTPPRFTERSGGMLVELQRTPVKAKLGNGLGNSKSVIMKEMKANPKISGARLSEILGISRTAVEKHIKQLRKDGLIERIGGTRGRWKVNDS